MWMFIPLQRYWERRAEVWRSPGLACPCSRGWLWGTQPCSAPTGAEPPAGSAASLTFVVWEEGSCGCCWKHPGSKIHLGTTMPQQGSYGRPLFLPCHLCSFRASVWCLITGGADSEVSHSTVLQPGFVLTGCSRQDQWCGCEAAHSSHQ